MAKVAAASSRVWFDEFNISSDISSFGQQIDQETPKTNGLATIGPTRVIGTHEVGVQHLGFFDGDTLLFDEFIDAAMRDTIDHYWTVAPEGDVEGNVAYDNAIRLNSVPRSADLGGATLLNFDGMGSAGNVRGLILGSVVSTGAENRTGRNQGATAAGTIYAVTFRLIAFSGTDITLTIEESSDDGGGDAYAAIVGLNSGALTGPGASRVEVSIATEAWKRLAITGTFTSATVLMTGGVVLGS